MSGGQVHPGPKMEGVVGAINKARGPAPWERLSDILQTPELSYNSPYLPAAPSEEHYEAFARHLLPLLRVEEEDRFVAYVYSQVLRPAKRGVQKKTVTNYKVVGEAAARTVFKFDANKQIVVESYTPMNIR